MLLLAESKTPTTAALTTVFDKTNLSYLLISVVLSLRTCISLHLKSMALSKPFFLFLAKITALLMTAAFTFKRIMVLFLYFAPSFGLFNQLHHWQWEKIQFTVRKQRNVTPSDLFVLSNIDSMPWSDIDRWNYNYDDSNPTSPEYCLYTVFRSGEYFGIFRFLLNLHTALKF